MPAVNKKEYILGYLYETPNFLAGFVLAFVYLLPSTILVDISRTIGTTPQDLSLIFAFYTIGGMLGQLTSVLYNIKLKKFIIIIGSYLALIPFVVAVSLSRTLIQLYVFYFIIGYIAGVIWVQANENILESKVANKDRMVTIYLALSAAGAVVAPAIATSFVVNGINWRYTFYFIILLVLIIIALYIFIPGKRKDERLHKQRMELDLKKIFFDRQLNRLFVITFLTMVIFVIAETVATTWFPTFLRLERMFDLKDAGLIYTVFMLSNMTGRIGLSFFAGKVKSSRLIFILLFITIISTTVVIFFTQKAVIFIFIVLAGIGYSGIFPLLFSTAGTIYRKGRGILVTVLTISDFLGLSIAPYLTRYISRFSMMWSISLAVIFLGLALMLHISGAIYKNRLRTGEAS